MSLTTGAKVLGTHALIFPNGGAYTVPGAGTASRTAKPGATDPAWIDLGVIEDSTDSPVDSDKMEIFAPTPGVLRKYDEVETKMRRKGKFTSKELSAQAIQILYRTLALTSSSTQFNSMAGVQLKCWLKLQRYDQTDTVTIVEDLFVILRIASDVKMGGGLAEVEFEYDVLYSTLNTGTL